MRKSWVSIILIICMAVMLSAVAGCVRRPDSPNPDGGNNGGGDKPGEIANLNINDGAQTTEYPSDFTDGWGIGNGTVKQGMTYRPYIVTENDELVALFTVRGPSKQPITIYHDRFFVASVVGDYTVTARVEVNGEETVKTATVTSQALNEDVVLARYNTQSEIDTVTDVYPLISKNQDVFEYSLNTDSQFVTEGTGSLKIVSTGTYDAIDESRWPTVGFFGKPGKQSDNYDERTAFDSNGKPIIKLVDFGQFSHLTMDIFVPEGHFRNYLLMPLLSATEGHELGYGFVPVRGQWYNVIIPIDMITTGKNNIFSMGLCSDKVNEGDTIYVDNIVLHKGDADKALLNTFDKPTSYIHFQTDDNITAGYNEAEPSTKFGLGIGEQNIFMHTTNGAYWVSPDDMQHRQQYRAILLKDLSIYSKLTLRVKASKTLTVKLGFTSGAIIDEDNGGFDPAVEYGAEYTLSAGEWTTIEYDLSIAKNANISLKGLDDSRNKGYSFLVLNALTETGADLLVRDFYAIY